MNFRGTSHRASTKPGFTDTPREKDLYVEDMFYILIKFRDLVDNRFCPSTQGK
jgi:hypothetical protein